MTAASRSAATLHPARELATRQLPYNVGRVGTYSILGAIAGGAGGAALNAATFVPVQRGLFILANVFLFALAASIARRRDGFAWLQGFGTALFARALPAVRPLAASQGLPARIALGLVWGLVPCALTYSVLPIALFAGGPVEGAAVMLAFGLGTLPNLLAAGWVIGRARRWLDRNVVRYSAAALLAGFAAVGVWRALWGPLSLAQGPFCLVR